MPITSDQLDNIKTSLRVSTLIDSSKLLFIIDVNSSYKFILDNASTLNDILDRCVLNGQDRDEVATHLVRYLTSPVAARKTKNISDRLENLRMVLYYLNQSYKSVPFELDLENLRNAFGRFLTAGLTIAGDRFDILTEFLGKHPPNDSIRLLVKLLCDAHNPVRRPADRILIGLVEILDAIETKRGSLSPHPAINFIMDWKVFSNIYWAYQKQPPNSNFAGFIRWGTGNHVGRAENLEEHFFKHVICGEFKVSESEWWWEQLEIRPTWTDLEPFLMPLPNVAVLKTYFDSSGRKEILREKVANFLNYINVAKIRVNNTRLAEFFKNQYMHKYQNYALDKSRDPLFIKKRIHNSEGKVMISGGVYNPKGHSTANSGVFIVGRLNNLFKTNNPEYLDNTVMSSKDSTKISRKKEFEVSSCYYCSDLDLKLNETKKQIFWSLK